MRSVNSAERYHLVTPLPPLGGWRRMLALDRRGGPAGPVVLSFAPPALLDDPARLAALSRDAEAGARVHHANVVQVIGLETVEDQLALVEPYRPGTTLRALLDASGRLPVELAVRVACDAAAGLGALHAVDPGDGMPFAHGVLTAERILVAENGASLVEGAGMGGGRSPADDVRALAAVVFEAVAGEEPPTPPRPLVAPGVPPPLAAVLDRALGAAPGGPFPSAAALAEALAAAFPPATVEAMAVYAEAVAPAPAGPPPAPEAPEVSAELIAPTPETVVEATPTATPASERTPVPDAAITFPAPRATLVGKRMPVAAILAALALVGFAGGFGISRWRAASRPAPAPAPAGDPAPVEAKAAPPEPTAAPAGAAAPAPAAPPPAAAPATPPAAPAAAPRPRPAPAPSLSVTAVPAVEVLVDGKSVGRAPVLVEVQAGEHEVRLRDRAQRVDVRRKVIVKAPATPVRFQLARGALLVTAPADVEIWVDGRLAGKGDQKVDLWEGPHVVEARRAGSRAVHESFELTPEQTSYTYTVTPTP